MPAELLRYLLAGVLNTLVGYLVFLGALHLLSLDLAWSNVISYAVGLVVAFTLNKNFVFQGRQHDLSAAGRFAAGFAVSFAVNSAVLYIANTGLGIRAEIAQLLAMASYTVTFYLINKYLVFPSNRDRDPA